VVVSSHLLSEVAQSVDDVVVISHGVLRANGPLEGVLGSGVPVTRVRSPENVRLGAALRERGMSVESDGSDALIVRGASNFEVGEAANDQHVVLSELVAVSRTLEEAFFELTGVDE
jgi:ABC-2 type transport system ATP-binding protein